MTAALLLLFIISTLSLFLTVYFNKRFEETILLSFFISIILIYFFGLLCSIKLGIYLVLLSSIVAIVLSLIKIVRGKIALDVVNRFFTPAFFIYFLIFILIFYLNIDRVPISWDEFSHWADVVKVMWKIDGFATSPLSESGFQSYPPAMSILQLFFVEVGNLFASKAIFNESKLFIAYQIFSFTLFIPFMNKFKGKSLLNIIIVIVIILLSPLLFNTGFFSIIYIDTFLGLIAGFAIIYPLFFNKNKFDYTVWLCSLFILTLTKDSGFFFALCSVILCLLRELPNRVSRENCIHFLKKTAIYFSPIIVAKVSWKLSIVLNGANVRFKENNSLTEVLDGTFHGTGYYPIVIKKFIDSLFTQGIRLSDTGIFLNYIVLFTVLFAFVYFVLFRVMDDSLDKKNRSICCVGTVVISVVYVMGILISYLFKFVEVEAINLASLDRYLSTSLYSILFVVLATIIYAVSNLEISHTKRLVILILLLFSIPLNVICSLYSKDGVESAIAFRENYDKAAQYIEARTSDTEYDKIFFISQEDQGFNKLCFRYLLRFEVDFKNAFWSLGPAFYEGDYYSKNYGVDEWKKELISGFDFVFLHKVNQYFIDTYNPLFANSNIKENTLYHVDKQTGLLFEVE